MTLGTLIYFAAMDSTTEFEAYGYEYFSYELPCGGGVFKVQYESQNCPIGGSFVILWLGSARQACNSKIELKAH